MNITQKSFNLSELEMLEEYIYYNQPILFSCRDSSGQLFIGFWLGETEEDEAWLYLPISWQQLQAVRTGEIELREAFLKAEEGFALKVTIPYSDRSVQIETIATENLDRDELPMAGECLNCDPHSLPVLAR